ncbi:MAG TPA: sulfatase [Clostridiales bacterium]|nr:sulfatase [Clostridiales bacterium]
MNTPNIVFIMSDDHACNAISCYNGMINKTPNIDRIAEEGLRLDNCLCTNSICTPSRAVILTGLHSHKNGVYTLADRFDSSKDSFVKQLKNTGYQTAMIGKWHLGHSENSLPQGFDYWSILPGQGLYHNPEFIEVDGRKTVEGYVTDIITDKAINWLDSIDTNLPFYLSVHHKAPHRPWIPDEKHKHMYDDIDIPEPENFNDDYSNRSEAARNAKMRIEQDMNALDLKVQLKEGYGPYDSFPIPENLHGYEFITNEGETVAFKTKAELKSWKYQRYIKEYLRCIASIDDNVGRLYEYLNGKGILDNTLFIYTSDQGFFLGEHGWYDKRFMYEESLKMPFVARYPKKIPVGSVCDHIITNLDFAPTFLDFAGVSIPSYMQGKSAVHLFEGFNDAIWQDSMYYRYWMHLTEHNVPAHYGIRTKRYKLIYYYGKPLGKSGCVDRETNPEWELFDLEKDPMEMNNVYFDTHYQEIVKQLKEELEKLKLEAQDFE